MKMDAATLDGGVPTPRGSSKKPSPADFMFGTTLGEGAYARVRLCGSLFLYGAWLVASVCWCDWSVVLLYVAVF